MKSKNCARCGVEFIPRTWNAKFCGECKPKMKQEYNHKYYAKRRDEHCEYCKQYYAAHREEHLERVKQYVTKNYEQVQEYLRERQRDPKRKEYAREYSRKWRIDNPDITRMYDHKRRARVKGNGGSYTLDEINDLFEKQEGFCFYCGELLYSSFDKDIHVEHKIPLSRGGTSNISNIALSCARCNLQKGTRTHEEFLRARSF